MTIVNDDCLAALRRMPDKSANCIVTSPPYWGLRDYGTAKWEGGSASCDHRGRSQTSSASTLGEWKNGGGARYKEGTGGMPFSRVCGKCGARRVDSQLGLEASPDLYVERVVLIFREARRVLRDDGTLWMNLGDSYADGGRGGDTGSSTLLGSRHNQEESRKVSTRATFNGLRPKNLIGIPWRVAFALQADGWYLRADIIWNKPNPMPESVVDRPTKSHEYLFLFSKSEKYYYDAKAIAEPISASSIARIMQPTFDEQRGGPKDYRNGVNPNRSVRKISENFAAKVKADRDVGVGDNARPSKAVPNELSGTTRNKRSVWTIATVPFKGAHFATYPPDLVKPCVLAGCPAGGVVLDPFAGSGTTGMVALELGRRAVLVELNPEYVEIIRQRCAVTGGLGL